MKTIGILGGMSWESTAVYYRWINETVRQRMGGLHSARIVLISVDFATIEPLQAAGDWTTAGERLAADARRVAAGGADFLVLATNTMHKCAPAIEAAIDIPLVHIADATVERLAAHGARRVGLLGTRYTMEQPFYRERIEQAGFEVVVPDTDDRTELNRIIFDELCLGTVRADSRDRLIATIEAMRSGGADAVIAGCTEIELLVGPQESPLPLFDTTAIHAEAAVERALEGETAA